MHAIHAEARENDTVTSAKENRFNRGPSSPIRPKVPTESIKPRPFAVVEGEVNEDSPAYQCGIRAGLGRVFWEIFS